LRFRLPIGAPEALGCGQIPSSRIRRVAAGFEISRKFESDHGVACFGKEIGELPCGIFTRACASYTRCDLFPISHTSNGF
jgi:hypothetical protein